MSTQSRQLAAIIFAGIVGYTALMGNDGQKAFEFLEKEKQIQKKINICYTKEGLSSLKALCY